MTVKFLQITYERVQKIKISNINMRSKAYIVNLNITCDDHVWHTFDNVYMNEANGLYTFKCVD